MSSIAQEKVRRGLARGASSFDLASAFKQYDEGDQDHLMRNPTVPEIEVLKRKEAVASLMEHMPSITETPSVAAYMPPFLNDAIFCGHLVTDMDSIAGAIGRVLMIPNLA